MCVCVWERERERESFLNKVWSSLIWFKATEFSKQLRKSILDESKVKPYFTRAQPPSSDTLPLSYNTFLLFSPLVTVYFRNNLVTHCFFRDKFKNIFIAQKHKIFSNIRMYWNLNVFYHLVLEPRKNARIYKF